MQLESVAATAIVVVCAADVTGVATAIAVAAAEKYDQNDDPQARITGIAITASTSTKETHKKILLNNVVTNMNRLFAVSIA